MHKSRTISTIVAPLTLGQVALAPILIVTRKRHSLYSLHKLLPLLPELFAQVVNILQQTLVLAVQVVDIAVHLVIVGLQLLHLRHQLGVAVRVQLLRQCGKQQLHARQLTFQEFDVLSGVLFHRPERLLPLDVRLG